MAMVLANPALRQAAKPIAAALANKALQYATLENAGKIVRYIGSKRSKKVAPFQRASAISSKQAPLSVAYSVRKVAPKFRAASGNYVVSNREFLSDVKGSGANFSLLNFPINPGLAQTFPWLSMIANSHQMYRLKAMKIVYIPLAATTERGRLTLAYTPDVLDILPVTKQQLVQYPTAVEGSVWSTNTLVVPPSSFKQLFTRMGGVASTDLKTYDNGEVLIGVNSTADTTTVIGEVYLDYTIEFTTPKPAVCPSSAVFTSTNFNNGELFGAGATATVPKTTTFVGVPWVGISNGTRNQISMPGIGSYLVYMNIQAASASTVAIDVATFAGNATVTNLQTTTSATNSSTSAIVNTIIPNAQFVLTITGVTKTSFTLYIDPITPSLQLL